MSRRQGAVILLALTALLSGCADPVSQSPGATLAQSPSPSSTPLVGTLTPPSQPASISPGLLPLMGAIAGLVDDEEGHFSASWLGAGDVVMVGVRDDTGQHDLRRLLSRHPEWAGFTVTAVPADHSLRELTALAQQVVDGSPYLRARVRSAGADHHGVGLEFVVAEMDPAEAQRIQASVDVPVHFVVTGPDLHGRHLHGGIPISRPARPR